MILNHTTYDRAPHAHATLFYFHGGGLMFGNRDDLPQEIRDYWHHQGYNILAVDYPLAPEATLDDIIRSLQNTIQLCIDTYALTHYSFFGRSAGAFLAFQLHRSFAPEFIISFYGYTISDRQWLLEPNKHYSQYPTLNPTSLARMVQTIPPYRSTIESRYALYVNARQTGTWLQQLQTTPSSIDPTDLPPTFLWHSIFDPDVPFRESKYIVDHAPQAELHHSTQRIHEIDTIAFKDIETPLTTFLHEHKKT